MFTNTILLIAKKFSTNSHPATFRKSAFQIIDLCKYMQEKYKRDNNTSRNMNAYHKSIEKLTLLDKIIHRFIHDAWYVHDKGTTYYSFKTSKYNHYNQVDGTVDQILK